MPKPGISSQRSRGSDKIVRDIVSGSSEASMMLSVCVGPSSSQRWSMPRNRKVRRSSPDHGRISSSVRSGSGSGALSPAVAPAGEATLSDAADSDATNPSPGSVAPLEASSRTVRNSHVALKMTTIAPATTSKIKAHSGRRTLERGRRPWLFEAITICPLRSWFVDIDRTGGTAGENTAHHRHANPVMVHNPQAP